MHVKNERRVVYEPGTPTETHGTPITCKDSHMYLGLVIENKLKWNKHINYLRGECQRRLNQFKWFKDWTSLSICHTRTGELIPPLLRIYAALIKSKLEYWVEAYGSASPTPLPLELCHLYCSYATCISVMPLVLQLRHLYYSYATSVAVTSLVLLLRHFCCSCASCRDSIAFTIIDAGSLFIFSFFYKKVRSGFVREKIFSQTWKTTAIRRTAVREIASLSASRGHPWNLPYITALYRIEGFKGGPQLPRHASLSDSQFEFFLSGFTSCKCKTYSLLNILTIYYN